MTRLPPTALLGAVLLLGACGGQTPARPNVLLISIDTLRADHLGCYGYAPYPDPVSPTLDRLAGEGARFARMFAPRGQTAPSLCSMMTGKYPSAHGVRDNGMTFRGEHATLAELLGDAGYETTALISEVPDAPEGSPRKGFARSLDLRELYAAEAKSDRDARVAAMAQGFLQQRGAGAAPFFLWCHFYDVHRPYHAPAPYTGAFVGDYQGRLREVVDGPPMVQGLADLLLADSARTGTALDPADQAFARALYDGGIRSTDEHVKEVLDTLAERGLAEDTLVVVVADHGDELGDHAAYWFHGNSVYDSTLHIPCLVRLPGVVPAGTVIPGLAQNVDLLPTVLTLLGLDVPADVEGVSFADALRDDPEARPRQWVMGEWQDLIVTVRDEEWKYIFNPQGVHPKKVPFFQSESQGFPIRCEELYHVATDPREQEDVLAEHAGLVTGLRRRASAWMDRPAAVRGWLATEDEAVIAKLLANGYVGTLPGRPDVLFGAEHCGN